MLDRMLLPTLALAALLFAAGCAPVISKGLREQADKNLTFEAALRDPGAHAGKTVVWGGVLVSAKHLGEGTLLEIVQKPLDFQLCPKETDRSGGRFLALYNGYLDAAIYEKGREVTLAGVIRGERVLPMDEIEYAYPLVDIREIFLWEPEENARYYPYPYPYWQSPGYYRFHGGPP
ncbi:MAG: Slp/YeaY family lipoprotein [Deltaproteobacteria bacterium]|nr:Slp/YeaY family lipoprotein [Deltaproteobacteria bacterium]MBW2283933.1 Slp/YeaY family lipoprotein [Deltaproteobacteria bacterium]